MDDQPILGVLRGHGLLLWVIQGCDPGGSFWLVFLWLWFLAPEGCGMVVLVSSGSVSSWDAAQEACASSPMGGDWLWRKLGLALVGKCLIQLSCHWWWLGCCPISCLALHNPVLESKSHCCRLPWPPGGFCQHTPPRDCCCHAPVPCRAGHCGHTFHRRSPHTTGSLVRVHWAHSSFPLVVVHTKLVSVLHSLLFPIPWDSESNPTGSLLSDSGIPWVPLLDSNKFRPYMENECCKYGQTLYYLCNFPWI